MSIKITDLLRYIAYSCKDKFWTTLEEKQYNWELNFGEYATMMKLTLNIHNKCLTKFKQE